MNTTSLRDPWTGQPIALVPVRRGRFCQFQLVRGAPPEIVALSAGYVTADLLDELANRLVCAPQELYIVDWTG